jgi:ribosomal protein L7/L12
MTPDSLDKLRTIHKLLGEVIDAETATLPLEKRVDPETHLTYEEVQLMRAGMPINAIKEVRHRTGLTLADAKNLVEAAGTKLGLRVPDPEGWGGHRWTIPLK